MKMKDRRMHSRAGLRPWAVVLSLPLLFAASSCGDGSEEPTGPGPGTDAYDHGRAAGASANDILSDTDFDRLVVQVQYVEGFRPTDEALLRLEDFLNARVNKPGGVVVQLDEPLRIDTRETYSPAEVRALEAEHRTAFTEEGTLATYLLFLDGEYSESSNVLGIAYNNTSMAIFSETIRQHSGGAFGPSHATVETAVANHEIGHLLGLVNNGSDMQTEHQDEPNGSHCDNDRCLMYYAVRTTDFIQNLVGGIPELDQDCIDDLRANGGKE